MNKKIFYPIIIIIVSTISSCSDHKSNNLKNYLIAQQLSSLLNVIVPEVPDNISPINVVAPGFDSQVSVTESEIPIPETINYHNIPIGKVYNIVIPGHEEGYNFGDQYAELHYRYDKNELADSELVEDFNVYYFDRESDSWKPVDYVKVDEDNSEVIAYTNHLTPFVLCATTDQWVTLGDKIYSDSNNYTFNPSMAFDVTIPYVAFEEIDKTYSFNRIYVQSWNNNTKSWSIIGGSLNNDINAPASNPSITIKDSIPYVAFIENSGSNQLFVKQWNGSEWKQIGLALNVNTNESVFNPQIIFYDKVPCVVWNERNGVSSRIYVKYWNGSEWTLLGNALNINATSEANFPSITYSGLSIYVSWSEVINGKSKAYVKSWNGTNWVLVGDCINNDTGSDIGYITIISRYSYVYIAYNESYNNRSENSIKVQKYIDSKWVQIGPQLNRESSISPWHPSITIVKSQPYVTWYELDGNICNTYVSHWNGNVWQKNGDTLNITKSSHTWSPLIGYNGVTFLVALYQSDSNSDYVYVKAGNWNETLADDPTAPSITKFICTSTMPITSKTISLDIEGRDDKGITGWMITENPTQPDYKDPRWLNEKPTEISSDFSSSKFKLYAWVKDGDGNVSNLYYSVSIDLIPWNKDISSFSFTKASNPGLTSDVIGIISGTDIMVTLPPGNDVTNLVATFDTTGKSVKVGEVEQVSNVTANNFTDNVTYTVSSKDGTTKDYTITVFVPGAFDITSFLFTSAANPGLPNDAIGVITGSNIAVSVPSGTDVTKLSATFSTTGKTVSVGGVVQESGVTINDFTGNLTYRVTAKDGTYKDYLVSVKVMQTLGAQWAQSVTAGSGSSILGGISIAPDGSIYAAGWLYGTGEFNFGNNVTAVGTSGLSNILLVKYNSSGMAQWAQSVTAGSGSSILVGISVAPDGSIYAVGSIRGTSIYNFGNGVTVAGANNSDSILLVKYNSSGVAQWAQTVITGSGSSFFSSVSVASDGTVYAAGYIYGASPYNFGNGVATAGPFSGNNIVLVKYNSSGMAQWAQSVTVGSSDSSLNSVSVASNGSIYTVGYVVGIGIYNFGNNVTAAGTSDSNNIVLIKYNSSGVAQWAQSVTVGSNYSEFRSVSVASDGSVYSAGSIDGTGSYNFGNNVTLNGPYNASNILLVKYNSSGIAQWAQTATAGSNKSEFSCVSVASDGSVYTVGSIDGTGNYNFGNNVTLNGPYNASNILLVKYNSSGVAQWAQTVTAGTNKSSFANVSVTSEGSIYAAGFIYGTNNYNFGNGVIASGTATSNIILVKYK